MNNINKFLSAIAAGMLILFVSLPVMAQTPADVERAARESERLQREQQLRQQEDRNRSLETGRPDTHLEMPLPETQHGQGEGCQKIRRIRITGGLHMADLRKEEIVKPYVPKCLGVAEIQQMLSDITAYYIEMGFTTTRVYLPAQDLSTETLHIDIIEGVVGSLQREEGDTNSMSLTGAFPGVEGRIMNLRDFEQGLDQINRLQSNSATLDIAPGEQVGQSIITIRNKRVKRWHANVTGDNYGTRGTGRRQAAATLSYDNFLHINDFFSITERKTVPFDKFDKQSSSLSGLFSFPIGYWTFTGGYSKSDYDSSLDTPTGIHMLLNGDNRSIFGTVDKVVYRDQVNKVTMSGTLTDKKSRNFIAGQKIDVSSRELAVADIGINLSTLLFGGNATLGATYSRGLKILGALQDTPGQNDELPKAQFDKYGMNASWSRPFTVAEQNLTWSSQLTAQTAHDTLYGSEQISIGGIYSVRGFHEESLANDDGYYIRNDLTLRENLGNFWGYDILFNPYAAIDAGAVTGRVDDTPHGTLVGGAVGSSLVVGPANFDFFAGHPISAPEGLGEEGWTTFGRLSMSF